MKKHNQNNRDGKRNKNSRKKGKVGEREFAAMVRDEGFDARRGQQFSGGADSPDITSNALAWLHFEVKRVQHLNLIDACVQAEGDCGGKPWVVAHRRNNAPWLITMRSETFFQFLRGTLPPENKTTTTNRMKIKNNSDNFKPHPEYTGPAVLVDVTPLKTVQTQYGPKEKFRFVFETGEKKDDGTPWCVWSAPFTPSYHENAALRPFLRKWLGHELTPAEIKTFDTEDLLGRSALVTIVHEHSGGDVFANIALIQPDKSATPLKPSGKFVRLKDRPPKDTSGYRHAEPASNGGADWGATKIHIGKCRGMEIRDLSLEQVGALVENWLPTAKANVIPTADDQRLIAALDQWQATQPVSDDVPF